MFLPTRDSDFFSLFLVTGLFPSMSFYFFIVICLIKQYIVNKPCFKRRATAMLTWLDCSWTAARH